MKISNTGLSLIKEFEGCILSSYDDAVGLKTLGYGHLLSKAELHTGYIYIEGKKVLYGKGIIEQQAEKLLEQDLKPIERNFERLSKDKLAGVKLSQGEIDALYSFIFNVGVSAFNRSTLLKRLSAGDVSGASEEFGRWVYAGGVRLEGLARRRAAESKVFIS